MALSSTGQVVGWKLRLLRSSREGRSFQLTIIEGSQSAHLANAYDQVSINEIRVFLID